jgi:hypothetical protein
MFTSKNQPSNSGEKATASLASHVKTQTGHTLDTADYGGHGHSQGKQGPDGHPMPPNDMSKQANSHIPQKTVQDSSDGSGSANANDPSTANYGRSDGGL